MRDRAVRLPEDVQRIIRALHPELKRRVRAALDLLRAAPENGKSLRGELEGWRSLRVGHFRIIYRASRLRIDVAAIGPGASIYLATTRLLRRKESGERSRPRRGARSIGVARSSRLLPQGNAPAARSFDARLDAPPWECVVLATAGGVNVWSSRAA